MIDITNLNLEQLEELQDKVHIRMEHLKQSTNIPLQDVKIGDCFIEKNLNCYYFYKIKEILKDVYKAYCVYFDFDMYTEEIASPSDIVFVDFSEISTYTSINPEVFEQASKLEINFNSQLRKIKDQLHSDIKTLIND